MRGEVGEVVALSIQPDQQPAGPFDEHRVVAPREIVDELGVLLDGRQRHPLAPGSGGRRQRIPQPNTFVQVGEPGQPLDLGEIARLIRA